MNCFRLSALEEVKKEFFDHYFTKRYFLQKKLKGDFLHQIMARRRTQPHRMEQQDRHVDV
jgi:hypothetical protein